jgi:serine/threonine protein kinase
MEQDVLNEVNIMQKLRHQHIATVLFHVKDLSAYSILMLPVADCDLLIYLDRCISKGYPVSATKLIYPWFGCLLDALAYAHKLNIKHRDIKPSNILIKDRQPFLADFGVAKDFTTADMSASREYFVQGTPVYRAPETKPDHPRGRRADIFALGCVFSEMLTVSKGKSLDAFRKWRLAPENTSGGVYAFRANLSKVREWLKGLEGDTLSDLLVDQITSMLGEDPEKRPTAQQSLNFLKREKALFCESH